MSQDNPVILHLEAWTREARSRFEFAAGKIRREELITRQRQIVAERKSLHDRGIKAYSFPGSQVNEWSRRGCRSSQGASSTPDAPRKRWPRSARSCPNRRNWSTTTTPTTARCPSMIFAPIPPSGPG